MAVSTSGGLLVTLADRLCMIAVIVRLLLIRVARGALGHNRSRVVRSGSLDVLVTIGAFEHAAVNRRFVNVFFHGVAVTRQAVGALHRRRYGKGRRCKQDKKCYEILAVSNQGIRPEGNKSPNACHRTGAGLSYARRFGEPTARAVTADSTTLRRRSSGRHPLPEVTAIVVT